MSIRPSAEAAMLSAASEPATKSLLGTEYLIEELETLKANVPDLAASFEKDFNPYYTEIADKCGLAWDNFDQRALPKLTELAGRVNGAIDSFDVTRQELLAERARKVQAATGPFNDGLKGAIRDERAMRRENSQQVSGLQAHLADVKLRLRELTIALTGRPDGIVRYANTKAMLQALLAGLVVFSILEVMGGFGLFRWVGDTISALGSSALLIIAIMVPGTFMALSVKKILAYHTAKRNAAHFFPGGTDEVTGKRVSVFPVDLTTYAIGLLSGLIFIGVVGWVLLWRTGIAAENSRLSGTSVAAIILFFAAWVLVIVEMYFAPSHDKEHLDEHKRVVDERIAIEDEISRLENEELADAVAPVIKRYREEIAAADEAVRNGAAELRNQCVRFVTMVAEYEGAADSVRTAYGIMVKQFTDQVCDEHPDLDRAKYGLDDQGTVDTILQAIDGYVKPRDFGKTVAKIRAFNPVLEPPTDGVLFEFDPVVDQARKDVEAEEAEALRLAEEQAKAEAAAKAAVPVVPVRRRVTWNINRK